MNLKNKRPLYIFVSSLVINGMLTNAVLAEPIYHPSGPQLTFGGMSHRIMTVSDMGNPAHPATMPYPEGDSGLYGAGLSIGLGIEYDGNDNFFKLLDEVANSGSAVPGDDGASGGDPDSGSDGNIIDITLPPLSPAMQAELEELVADVAAAAVLVGLSVTGINAKAFASADVPVLISNDALGGAWTFGANISLTTNISGINDPIDFDIDQAVASLKTAYAADVPTIASGPITYDLSGGASVTVAPDGSTKFRIDNNSGVVTKAAQITEISIGYSRKVWQQEDQKIHLGIRPKYFDVGLSNTAVPIADIEDARSIFKALDKSNFSYEQDFGVDIGAIWSARQYQLGVTLTNLNEPDFHFPERDLTGFTNPVVIQFLRERETYVMERQLKFEGGLITSDGAWGINFGLDANAVPDPMGDDYQWASVGAGFASDNWWLPSGRVGLRRNLAGSELTYVTAGLTVFDILSLDLAATTKTINIDGKTVPQGLIANIGVHVLF